MIVQNSEIQMHAEHEKRESYSLSSSMMLADSSKFSEQLQQVGAQLFQGVFADVNQQSDTEPNDSSILVMTEEGYKFRTEEDKQNSLLEQQEVTKSKLLESLLAAINPNYKRYLESSNIQAPAVDSQNSPSQTEIGKPMQIKPVMLEMNFKMTETIEEYECTSFSSCGKVTTADGREIEFDLNLTMEREYSASREFEMTQQVLFKDPLVVNFDGNSTDLSDDKYEFDIDADGENEWISYLLNNSGMLALDKNEDGVINDGSELFGALTGDGFAELAEYDEDGNNFIDEADTVFSDLGIWVKNPDGERLDSLADRGVGAIYLGSTDTPFDIKGEENQHNGKVISSGFYLSEAGEVGNIQQIDMVV